MLFRNGRRKAGGSRKTEDGKWKAEEGSRKEFSERSGKPAEAGRRKAGGRRKAESERRKAEREWHKPKL